MAEEEGLAVGSGVCSQDSVRPAELLREFPPGDMVAV